MVLDRQDTVTSGLPHGSHIACSQTHPSPVQSLFFITLISLRLIPRPDASNPLHRKIERDKEKEAEIDREEESQRGDGVGTKKKCEKEKLRGNEDKKKTDRRMGARDKDRLEQS